MDKNSEVYQNSNSFEEKEKENSDAVFRNSMESIISTDNSLSCSSSLNPKSSESSFVCSIGGTSGEHKKILKAKHQKRDSSHKLKILSSEECDLNFNIHHEDCKIMENKKTSQKRIKISHEISGSKAAMTKNWASKKSDLFTKDLPDFSANFPEMKIEEKEPMLETKKIEDEGMDKTRDLVKDIGSSEENLKETVPEVYNPLMESPIKTYTGAVKEKNILLDINKIADKPDKNMLEEKTNEDDEMSEMPNEDTAFSNYLDITIPRVGKHVFQNEERPLTNCYDLAADRNERRFNYMRETGMDDEVLRLVDEEANMSESEKKKKKIKKQQQNIEMARYVTELCSKILEELTKENINQKKIIYNLMKVLDANMTPTCLLYVPHLVHTIAFIRGRRVFKKETRLAADECYNYMHAMFPIPFGYNFETVYTSEMRKFLPDDFDKLESLPLDYGGIDDILENSDSDGDDNDKGDEDSANNYSLM